jgi:hypothetical protein
MRETRTIRRSAAQLGVHPGTAFRWRHRILGAVERADARELSGFVELDETRFRFSEKGKRGLARMARTRGYGVHDLRLVTTRQICALLACDRYGLAVSAVLPTSRVYDYHICECIMTRVRKPATILARARPVSPYGRAARSSGHPYIEVPRFAHMPYSIHSPGTAPSRGPGSEYRVNRVLAYIKKVRGWLPRFRGVATRYLQHYLVWHQSLAGRTGWLFVAVSGVARCARAGPAVAAGLQTNAVGSPGEPF